jgi:hypothetical protein
LRCIDTHHSRYAVAAGVLFALADVTKGQYGVLIPVLIIAGGIDVIYARRTGARPYVIALASMLACVAAWYGVQWALVGSDNFASHMASLQMSTRLNVLALRGTRILGNFGYLVRSGAPVFVVPGVLYVAWRLRRNGGAHPALLLLVVFVAVWLSWFAIGSIGFARYALDGFIIGMLATGKLVVDLAHAVAGGLNAGVRTRRAWLTGGGATLLTAAIVALAGVGFVRQTDLIVEKRSEAPQRFSAYLAANVGDRSVVESSEWELDALVDLNFHHPTYEWIDKTTALIQWKDPVELNYDPMLYRPEFLVDGPFSKWTGLYTRLLESGCCQRVYSAGEYDLYDVRNLGH